MEFVKPKVRITAQDNLRDLEAKVNEIIRNIPEPFKIVDIKFTATITSSDKKQFQAMIIYK